MGIVPVAFLGLLGLFMPFYRIAEEFGLFDGPKGSLPLPSTVRAPGYATLVAPVQLNPKALEQANEDASQVQKDLMEEQKMENLAILMQIKNPIKTF